MQQGKSLEISSKAHKCKKHGYVNSIGYLVAKGSQLSLGGTLESSHHANICNNSQMQEKRNPIICWAHLVLRM